MYICIDICMNVYIDVYIDTYIYFYFKEIIYILNQNLNLKMDMDNLMNR